MNASPRCWSRRRITIVAFLGPALMILTSVMIYPTVIALSMSVSEIDLASFQLRYQGGASFARVLGEGLFWDVARNSLLFTLGCTAGQFLLGLGFALLLNQELPGMKVFRMLLFVPWTIPIVVVAINWWTFYNQDFGMFSYLLSSLTGSQIGLLGQPSTALLAVMLANIWRGYPFAMLMLLAALKTVPASLYDAATVDGAGKTQLFRYVVVPWLRPVMSIVLILETIDALNMFTLINIMTGGGPAYSTLVFAQHVYTRGFQFFKFNEAAAISVVVLGITIAFTALYLRIVHGRQEGAA